MLDFYYLIYYLDYYEVGLIIIKCTLTLSDCCMVIDGEEGLKIPILHCAGDAVASNSIGANLQSASVDKVGPESRVTKTIELAESLLFFIVK